MKTIQKYVAIISVMIVGCSEGPAATPMQDAIAFAHIGVAGINIPQVDEPAFLDLFPDPPIGALGAFLPGDFDPADPDDTIWRGGGAWARMQSAVYEGVGDAAGLFAYAYQVDCTGGIVVPMEVLIPLVGATLNPTAAGLSSTEFGYIATRFDVPVDFEPLPNVLYTASLTVFNLSEFGGSSGIGGNTAAGFTDAVQDGDAVRAGSTTDNFWSGTILIFVTDRAPVITFAEVTIGVTSGPSSIAVLAPSPGVGEPDVPPGDIITDPPEIDPLIEVHLDVKPGSDPNSVNTKSKGGLPIGIYGSETFDVRDIDVSTITVECMGTTEGDNLKVAYEDLVVEDGIEDLIIHVPMQSFPWGAPRGTLVTITVTGELNDGTPFFGEDVVLIRQ